MNVEFSNRSIALSWIMPSTQFVLQQNSDLTTTNWATVTNTPAFNLDSLQNQVMLSATNRGGFYRLANP